MLFTALLLLAAGAAGAQTIYWDNPQVIVGHDVLFPQAESNDGIIADVWQEYTSTGDSSTVSLSIAVTTDRENWTIHRDFAGPYTAVGSQVQIFSLAVDPSGHIFVAVLTSSSQVTVYESVDDGATFSKLADIQGEATTVAPRLFVRAGGGLILFTSQGSQSDTGISALSIRYTLSGDGSTWSPFQSLVNQQALALNFSPYYTAYQGREYVAFQVLQTGNPAVYQIYVTSSSDNARTWSTPVLVTGFKDPVAPADANPVLFSNERPFITGAGGHLSIVWERSYRNGPPQIYYLELGTDGRASSDPERVTNGTSVSRDPRIILYQGREVVFWFDNSEGDDHVFMASFNGVFWQSTDVSRMTGSSIFGRPVVVGDSIYVLWYNEIANQSRLVFLEQDRSVAKPDLFGVTFTNGGRENATQYTFGWTAPPDPSGIAGFGYSVDQDASGQAPHVVKVLPNDRRTSVDVRTDGQWYVHLSTADVAGNWSPTTTIAFTRDTTPPGTVAFIDPKVDDNGFLESNSGAIQWTPPPDPDVAGYTYSFDYVSDDAAAAVPASFSPRRPPGQILTRDPQYSLQNVDNGTWALSVSAVDTVGNVGAPTVIYLHTDRYIPVTYISDVRAQRDALGNVTITIVGRGFAVGGLIQDVILDQDGEKPYDYTFPLSAGQYKVESDRIIQGPTLQGVAQGDYRVGVVHPTRGLTFTAPVLAIQPTGTVKFGNYAQSPNPIWNPIARPTVLLSMNNVILGLLVCLFAFLLVFSSTRIARVVQESRELNQEIHALMTGTRISLPQRRERLAAMKRMGMGLRAKFVLLITLLVVAVVAMVSVPLGQFMITTQQRNLAEGLQKNAEVLMDSLATGARTYLPDQNIIELGALPDQRVAMPEAQFVTITGYGANDAQHYDHVWASDDPNLQKRIDSQSFNPGVSRISDDVSNKIPQLQAEIDQEARSEVSGYAQQLQVLSAQAAQLASRSDAASAAQLSKDQQEINQLSKTMNDKLIQIADKFGSVPDYDPDNLSRKTTEYTFYKPIVYQSNQDNIFFRGVIRVGVTTKAILGEMAQSQQSLLIRSGVIAAIAIGLGIAGALVLAYITINPIRRLVRGVELIRDTDDKEQLRDHIIALRTRDELSVLADTVNQMTQGLVAAAVANKDLTLGKDTQKMFTPLEQDPVTSRKLTTAHDSNNFAELFGYYEGAKGVSGDYFDFRRIDDKHYAIIECDVAGKGVPASLIMVEVATIFADYVRNWSLKEQGIHLERLVYRINDLVEERGFKGRFAALLVIILNIETGACYFCNAGYRYVHIFDAKQGTMIEKTLPQAPAAGVFPSMMVEMQSGFSQIPHRLSSGDCLLLFTDGVEEAKRHFRDADRAIIQCKEPGLSEGEVHDTHPVGADNEEFGIPRINGIVDAVFSRSRYRLSKNHTAQEEILTFNFSTCTGTVEEAVLALVSVERIFRIYPDPTAGPDDRIMMDKKVVEFLEVHFEQFDTFFREPIPHPSLPEYVYYAHLREDEQYDDLTILGVRKK